MKTPRIDKINKEIDHYKHPINCYNIIRCCEYYWGEDFFDQTCNFFFDHWLNDFYDYLIDIGELDEDTKIFLQLERKWHTPQFIEIVEFLWDLVPDDERYGALYDSDFNEQLELKVRQLFADFICQTDDRRRALFAAVHYTWHDEYQKCSWDARDYRENKTEYNKLKQINFINSFYEKIGGKPSEDSYRREGEL